MTEISENSISDFDSSWREFIFMLSTFVSVVKFMCMDHESSKAETRVGFGWYM